MSLKYFIKVLFTPSCWFRNYEYNKEWDEYLLELMKTEKFSKFFVGTAKFGHNKLWVANYPYACFHHPNFDVMPSRVTVFKLREKFLKDVLGE